MIRFISAFFLLFMLLFSQNAFAENGGLPSVREAQFFSSMQDVPLVAGLEELRDQSVTFDKPEGRIVESVAEIQIGDFQTIQKAYEETLPQLGWKRISENSYAREKEFLHLNFESYEGRNFVRVLVRPQEGSVN